MIFEKVDPYYLAARQRTFFCYKSIHSLQDITRSSAGTTSACTAIAKVHLFTETPSSFIQHAKELSSLKLVLLLQDTPCGSAGALMESLNDEEKHTIYIMLDALSVNVNSKML